MRQSSDRFFLSQAWTSPIVVGGSNSNAQRWSLCNESARAFVALSVEAPQVRTYHYDISAISILARTANALRSAVQRISQPRMLFIHVFHRKLNPLVLIGLSVVMLRFKILLLEFQLLALRADAQGCVSMAPRINILCI